MDAWDGKGGIQTKQDVMAAMNEIFCQMYIADTREFVKTQISRSINEECV